MADQRRHKSTDKLVRIENMGRDNTGTTKYVAECECGWLSDFRASPELAFREFYLHAGKRVRRIALTIVGR